MKNLNVNQMEILNGGTACHDKAYGLASGIAVTSAFGGPVSWMVGLGAAAVISLGSIAVCGGQY